MIETLTHLLKRATRRIVTVKKVHGTCVICGHYGIGGVFDGAHVCALCIKEIIGRHPDEAIEGR